MRAENCDLIFVRIDVCDEQERQSWCTRTKRAKYSKKFVCSISITKHIQIISMIFRFFQDCCARANNIFCCYKKKLQNVLVHWLVHSTTILTFPEIVRNKRIVHADKLTSVHKYETLGFSVYVLYNIPVFQQLAASRMLVRRILVRIRFSSDPIGPRCE